MPVLSAQGFVNQFLHDTAAHPLRHSVGQASIYTEWGMYVEIAPTKIEGMVPLREIRSDFFEYDEKRYRLVGKRTHKVFLLGDPVRIRVKDANLEQKLLDYELVEEV